MKDFQKIISFFMVTLIFVLSSYRSEALIFQSVASGNFNTLIWNQAGLYPTTGDTVVINTGTTVTINGFNTDVLGSVTINSGGNLTIANNAVAQLVFAGDLVVSGTLINNGRINMTVPGNFVLGNGAVYDHNPKINIAVDENVFENGVENFSPTSTLIIRKWASTALPLAGPTRVTSDIGNLVTSVTGTTWEQRGQFSPNRIKGSLLVTDGVLRMDDGSGATTVLTLNDVTLRGNSAIIFQEGNNRNLTLTMGNFTDSSVLVNQPTIIMNMSLGTLNLTVNGNFITRHDFIAVFDSTFPIRSASVTANIMGDLLIQGSGNKFDFCKQVNAPLTLTVGGNTKIANNPNYVRFVDSGNGFLNYTTGDLNISAGLKNIFLGGNDLLDASNNPLYPLPTGYATVNVLNDFNLSGVTNTTILLSPGNVARTKLIVGHDLNSSSASVNFVVANNIGIVNIEIGSNLFLNGGSMNVQANASSNAIDSIAVTRSFIFNSTNPANFFRGNSGAGNTFIRVLGDFNLMNSGTAANQGVCGTYLNNGNLEFYVAGNFNQSAGAFYGIQDGTGRNTFTVDGTLNQSGGFFKGTHATNIFTAGKSIFTLGGFSFSGGNYIQYNAANDSVICTVNGDFNVNYTAVTNLVSFIPYLHPVYSNTSPLKLTVTGDMYFGGANGTFYSSVTQGNELISIGANLTFDNGNNSFNNYPSAVITTTHNVNITVGGNLTCNNGINNFSAGRGDLAGTINGDLIISGGTLSLKSNSAYNPIIINVLGGFNMTNGNFFYTNNATIPPITTTVTINSDDDNTGDFVHSGGTINFVNNTLNPTVQSLTIKSPNVLLGPSGTIKRNGAGTIASRGALDFARTGTTLFTRLNGHTVDHTVLTVVNGTTLEVISGDVQLTSYVEEFAGQTLPMLYVSSGATFTLRNNSSVYTTGNFLKSTVQGASGSRIRIQHTNGFYSGFSSAAINSSGNMGFLLSSSSTVEYFGDDNQIITGIGMGNAVGGNQKYGVLEINFGGDPNTEYVYPTSNGTVNVRNQLKLTAGQLRLDDDNDPTNGGRTIIIENSPNTSITRVAGYIRAETYDGASNVKWMFAADNTPHIFPFGLDPTTYIPLTVTSTGGNAGFITASTFKTSPANLPYPPGVGHVNSVATGADNSADCVDRFWKINQSGTSTTFNAVFSAPVAEFPAIAGPYKAQHYNYVGGFWDNPFQGAQAYASAGPIRTVTATGVSVTNDWWVLVNQNTPLPVELLSFDANCVKNHHQIKWTTASELNNDFFTLEKSADGTEFTLFRKIEGSGTVNDSKNYEVSTDDGIAAYYRLRQYDFNGTMHDLKTIYAPSCQNDEFKLLSVNQVEDIVNAIVSSPDNIKAEITLFDLKGALIFKEEVSLSTGVNSVRLPINLAKGLYYFQIINDNQVTQGRKFLVN